MYNNSISFQKKNTIKININNNNTFRTLVSVRKFKIEFLFIMEVSFS